MELLQKLEAIKSKGIALNLTDLEQLIRLFDDIGVQAIETKSKYIEEKNELENKKAIRYELLKSEVEESEDSKGNIKTKSKYTDEGVKSILKQEFREEQDKISVLGATVELLEHKKDTCEHYINLVKIIIK